jgi:hypothetical protein
MRSVCILAIAIAMAISACDTESGEGAIDATWHMVEDTDTWYLSVHGVAPDDLWAVGGTPTEGRIRRWDGAKWRDVDPGFDVPLLNWVYAFDADRVVIAGNAGTVLTWDGATFTKQQTPTEQDLWGIWGASPDDVWAVGGKGTKDGDQTVLRFDGAAWTQVTLPDMQRPKVFAFYKVWGSAADDVYIVGRNGAVLHWDGAALTELHVGASQDLISVWGTGKDHVVIVGGRSSGVVVRWDGVEWRHDQIGELPGINGVFLRSPGTIHVAANMGTLASLDFDTLEATVHQEETDVDFHAVFGDSSARLTAVGGNFLYQAGPYEGAVMQRSLSSDE